MVDGFLMHKKICGMSSILIEGKGKKQTLYLQLKLHVCMCTLGVGIVPWLHKSRSKVGRMGQFFAAVALLARLHWLDEKKTGFS